MPFWNPFARSKAPASNVLTSRNYYLGLSSVDAAFDAVDELSFCQVLSRDTGDIRIQNDNRIRVIVGPADDDNAAVRTEDTLLWIGGQFTPHEMSEIEALSKHSDSRALKKVAAFVAKIAAQGVKGTHHLLGQ